MRGTDEETYTVRPLMRKLILFKSSQKCVMADRSMSISSSVHLLLKLNGKFCFRSFVRSLCL